MERGRIQGRPKFFQYPVLCEERVKLQTSNLAGIFTASTRTKPVKNFGEKGAWAYPGSSPISTVPAIISRMRKATNCKFD